jgi:hypothetical protein
MPLKQVLGSGSGPPILEPAVELAHLSFDGGWSDGREGFSERRSKVIGGQIQPYDALHLASAVEGGADVFCTTDDALYQAGQTVETKGTDVLTPVELIEVIES